MRLMFPGILLREKPGEATEPAFSEDCGLRQQSLRLLRSRLSLSKECILKLLHFECPQWSYILFGGDVWCGESAGGHLALSFLELEQGCIEGGGRIPPDQLDPCSI